MLSTITMETDCNNFLGPVSDYAVNNMWATEAFYINAQKDYKMYLDPAHFYKDLRSKLYYKFKFHIT